MIGDGHVDVAGSNYQNTKLPKYQITKFRQKMLDGEQVDEVVREIDVYLSPELSAQLHLMQFPLQAATRTASREMAHPGAAKIKPQHAALQLEYPFEDGMNAPTNRRRLFDSYHVPVVTHMALGRFDASGSVLHLVPLSNVVQMRPSMDHIQAQDESEPEAVAVAGQSMDTVDSTKLMFHRPESEKSITSRRSSYAYYQAAKAAEPWIDLTVQAGSAAPNYGLHIPSHSWKHEDVDNNNTQHCHDVTASYVKTLNYIPQAIPSTRGERAAPSVVSTSSNTIVEEFTVPYHSLNDMDTFTTPSYTLQQPQLQEDGSHTSKSTLPTSNRFTHAHTTISSNTQVTVTPIIPTWKKDLTTIVTNLLQGPGTPIPYLVIRSRFPMISSHLSDEDLLEAVSSCAVMVRGNFLLKSSLLPMSNPRVCDARDLILLLIHKYGFVHREIIIQVLCANTVNTNVQVSSNALHGILTSVGRKTRNGVELKVDDDTFVETYYPHIAALHTHHWARKEERMLTLVQQYEHLVLSKIK